MSQNSHTPVITHIDPGIYNLTFDYFGYSLSFLLGTPPELLIFEPGSKEDDVTPELLRNVGIDHLDASAKGLRTAMDWIDSQLDLHSAGWHQSQMVAV